MNSDISSMHPSVKCSPGSSVDDEYETYEDLDVPEAGEHDDPLQCLVPVKQELLSPDSAPDVKPNVYRLEANLAEAGKLDKEAEISTSEVHTYCSKLGINKDNVVYAARAETEDDGEVDVDGSDGDSGQKASLHLCGDCGSMLTSAVNRLRHRCRKFKCGACEWRGTSQLALQEHKLAEHDVHRPHECPECKARFTDASNLRSHARMHAKGTTTCACPSCGANFNTTSNLARHVPQCRARQGIQDTKPFLCKLCLATFWQHNQVRRHVRAVHTLKKPFKCRVCVSSFASQLVLNNHVRQVHSVPRPFTCSVCFMRYSQREELMEHLQVHLVSLSSGRKMGVDKMSALAIKKEVGEEDRERRVTRSSTSSVTRSALENIKSYTTDSE